MADPTARALVDVACAVAREAGALIRARFAAPRQIATKSGAVDLVTDTDRAAERLILDRLQAAFPGHAVLAEESGALPAANPRGGICWVIDPLDGTTNFAHGVPHFAVSIAAVRGPTATPDEQRGARTLAGAVYDPMRDELFAACEDDAATLDGRPISVSRETALDASLLATGFPYDRRARLDEYLSFWRVLMPRVRDVRRIGAAALDLAWVACGRVDGFWEWRLKPWDVAAGRLIVQRAGGRATDFRGADPGVEASETLATNGAIHDDLLRAISPLVGAPRR